MKLYTHPGASSLHVHILLRECALPFELEVVDVTRKRRRDGSDFFAIAPRGMVPLLELDDGEKLTENIVLAQYVCDRAGRTDLMPAPGTLERYRVMEWQSFVATELHKNFGPLAWDIDTDMRRLVMGRIESRLAHVNSEMVGPYLIGDTFTAADAYLFVIANWALFFGVGLGAAPRVIAFLARVAARRSVREALDAEGVGRVDLSLIPPLP